jgi:hypothetical protein
MCLIVWKEGHKAQFTNRQFKNMISRNSDGLGIMWRETVDGVERVLVEKVLGSPKDKFKLFQKHRDKEYYAMHARFKTHGLVNLDNCHPYKILSIDDGDPIDLYMMHNGTIQDVPDSDVGMSDTWHFAEYIIKPLAKNNLDFLWNSDAFHVWLQKKISGSKLTLMRSDHPEGGAPVLILNHGAGTMVTGCWLSNTYSTSGYTNHNSTNYNRGNASTNAPFQHRTGTNLPATIEKQPVITRKPQEEGSVIMGPHKDRGTTTTPTSVTNEDEARGRVIDMFRRQGTEGPYSIIPDENLYNTACMLRGLPEYEVRLFVMDDPDLSADIIMAFYEKNTMKYEHIMRLIRNPDTLKGVVALVMHVAATLESIVKTRNVR